MQIDFEALALKKTLLLVDDEPANLHVLRQILQNDYQLLFATDGKKALQICEEQTPDLILLDILMPEMSGYDVCQALKQNPNLYRVPVIFISALSDAIDEAHGFEVGAVDYITKPISPSILRARVAIHLSLVRNEELQETRLQIIQRLGRASEYKDNETGLHVIRMSHYSRLLALASGLPEAVAEKVFQAAPMHNIGKIGIPDHILQKPGQLIEAEWKIMKQHPEIGAQIIGKHDSPLLQAAYTIALTHHEKWDGSGYPQGLQGEEIPLIGRIVALVDVFDALTSVRPYKKAWSVQETITYLQQEAGQHFDADLVRQFIDILPQVLDVKQCWAEDKACKFQQSERNSVPENDPVVI